MIERLLEEADAPYLEHLLLAALEGPGAASSASAGKVVAALFAALSRAGDERAIEAHLLPGASADADFEIKCWTAGNRLPSRSITGLSAPGAVRIALNLVRQSDEALEVVGRDSSGRLRCVLTRAESGPLEYRFPEGQRLRATRLKPEIDQETTPLQPSAGRQLQGLVDALNSRLDRVPDAEEISQIVQRVLGEMTVEVDLRGAPGEGVGGEGPPSAPEAGTGRQPSGAELADEVVQRLIDRRRAPNAAEIAEAVSRSMPALGAGQAATSTTAPEELRDLKAGVERLVEHVYSETATLANAVRMVVSSLGDLTSKVDYSEQRLLARMQRLEQDVQEGPAALPRARVPEGRP